MTDFKPIGVRLSSKGLGLVACILVWFMVRISLCANNSLEPCLLVKPEYYLIRVEGVLWV
jgi:hypothetical protein